MLHLSHPTIHEITMHDPHQLLPYAYRAASTVARSQLLAEEAGERAIHLLTLAVLDGSPPEHPKAWLRVVARRSASALLRSEWARTRSMSPEEISDRQAPYRQPRTTRTEFVCERIESTLTQRQRDALHAALTCNSTHAAARSCAMPPRDFRRCLGSICRRARQALEHDPFEDPFSDDANVQFALGR